MYSWGFFLGGGQVSVYVCRYILYCVFIHELYLRVWYELDSAINFQHLLHGCNLFTEWLVLSSIHCVSRLKNPSTPKFQQNPPRVPLIRIPYCGDNDRSRQRARAHGNKRHPAPRFCAPESIIANARREESLDDRTPPYDSRAEPLARLAKRKSIVLS